MDDEVQVFAQGIKEEVEDERASHVYSRTAFSSIIFSNLEQFEDATPLYKEGKFGNAIFSIDGYAFDEERSYLDIFTVIYYRDDLLKSVPSAEVDQAFSRAYRFVRESFSGLAAQLEPSDDASDLARIIEEKASDFQRLRIVLLTNGKLASDPATSRKMDGYVVDYAAYDVMQLHRILGKGERRTDIEVDMLELTGNALPCLHVPSSVGGYDAYMAVLPGDLLSRVYERYGARLLELNVRAFLGLRGRKTVNAELRKTIVEKPSMFLAFNNGIVATVDEIELDHSARAIRRLKGLQIVNGGQTTASLHRARRKESIKLDDISVPTKIIKVGGADLDEMVASISRAANRQNSVQLADFSANDPFHHRVEELANNTWHSDGRRRWFYERSRGSYLAAEQKASFRRTDLRRFRDQTPTKRRLNKLDLARYLSAWNGHPHLVSLGAQKNFQSFMQRIKEAKSELPDQAWYKRLIALAILYRSTERLARQLQIPAYKAQINAYLIASVSHKSIGGQIDDTLVWEKQQISSEMMELLRSWFPIINRLLRESAGERNPTEWFKKIECWQELRRQLPDMPTKRPPELISGAMSQAIQQVNELDASSRERTQIEQCMQISESRWLEVAARGEQDQLCTITECGVCRTLASHAARLWKRIPTAKQAKVAMRAVKKVEEAEY